MRTTQRLRRLRADDVVPAALEPLVDHWRRRSTRRVILTADWRQEVRSDNRGPRRVEVWRCWRFECWQIGYVVAVDVPVRAREVVLAGWSLTVRRPERHIETVAGARTTSSTKHCGWWIVGAEEMVVSAVSVGKHWRRSVVRRRTDHVVIPAGLQGLQVDVGGFGRCVVVDHCCRPAETRLETPLELFITAASSPHALQLRHSVHSARQTRLLSVPYADGGGTGCHDDDEPRVGWCIEEMVLGAVCSCSSLKNSAMSPLVLLLLYAHDWQRRQQIGKK